VISQQRLIAHCDVMGLLAKSGAGEIARTIAVRLLLANLAQADTN
jgi:hypothetical protein